MIKSFKHKGLKAYWEKGNARYLNAKWLPRIDIMLDTLNRAQQPDDLNVPGYHFHALKGKDKGRFSIRVTGNWRITFAFEGINAIIIDLEDYH